MPDHEVTFTVPGEQAGAWGEHLRAVSSATASDGLLELSDLEITPISHEGVPTGAPRYFECDYLLSERSATGDEVPAISTRAFYALVRHVNRAKKQGTPSALPDPEDCAEPFVSEWDSSRGAHVDSLHSSYLLFAAKNYKQIHHLGDSSAADIKTFLEHHGLWQD
jgi:hypothetical protein